jgi:hypothetical protein
MAELLYQRLKIRTPGNQRATQLLEKVAHNRQFSNKDRVKRFYNFLQLYRDLLKRYDPVTDLVAKRNLEEKLKECNEALTRLTEKNQTLRDLVYITQSQK